MDTCSQTKPRRFICQEAMNEALQAYHLLMTGQQKVVVRHGETEVRYEAKSVTALKQYIMSLHQSCPFRESDALLGIPTGRRP